MILISQNIENYDIKLPENTIFRINLAWCDSLDELKLKLGKIKMPSFFWIYLREE